MTGVPLKWIQSEAIRGCRMKMREKRERGAVVVEAVISMTTFMFAILIILSIADIAYTQSKMAVALNSAAKEISQYCFLYYKFQLDKVNAKAAEGTQDAENTVNKTVEGLGQMMDSFGQAGTDFNEGNFDSMVQNINGAADSANQTIGSLADTIAEDPRAFLVGMGKLAGREMTEAAKVYLGQYMARSFMAKNLKATADDNPDRFLKRLHVVDGISGLDFFYTSLMAYGSSNEINLVCTYQVEVIKLLNIDFTFTFRQSARTLAWGDGASLVTPRSIWTSMDRMSRGKYIVGEEKKGYTYTSSGDGYDAYVNNGGKNEFVTIVSMDTSSASYQTANGIKNRLSADFDKMYAGVGNLGNTITVQQNGQEKTVTSDPDSRTYRLVLVLPEGTDAEYKANVNQAITDLKAKYPNTTINVDVKEGYGSLPKKDEEPGGSNEENG